MSVATCVFIILMIILDIGSNLFPNFKTKIKFGYLHTCMLSLFSLVDSL